MPTEMELIKQARAGNDLAFQQLVQQHEQQLRATVVGMLGNVPEADDVAQEVFVRFYKSLEDFRGEAQLNTYLTRIAINLSLNELKRRQRKNKRLIFFQKNEKALQIEDTAVNPQRQDTKELVHKALQQLEPDFRTIIVLRMIDGYSVKETAEILKLPNGTVASRLARAQKKLKEVLQGWGVV